MSNRVPSSDPTRAKNRREKAGAWLAERRAVTWYLVNVGRVVDPFLMRISNGRFNSTGTNQIVVLTHTGRKSGLKRTTPLVYFTIGDDVILIASKGGAPGAPDLVPQPPGEPGVRAPPRPGRRPLRRPDRRRRRARAALARGRDPLQGLRRVRRARLEPGDPGRRVQPRQLTAPIVSGANPGNTAALEAPSRLVTTSDSTLR